MPQFMSGEASASVFKFSTRIVPTFLYLQNHGLCWIHIYDSLTCKWSPSQESSHKWDPLNSHASLFHIPCTFCQFHHHHDGRYQAHINQCCQLVCLSFQLVMVVYLSNMSYDLVCWERCEQSFIVLTHPMPQEHK